MVCNNILYYFSFNSINRPAVNEVAEHIIPLDWTFSEIQTPVVNSSKVIKRFFIRNMRKQNSHKNHNGWCLFGL